MKIAVIGTGTMGHGIAQVFAMYNLPVILCGRSASSINEAMQRIGKSIDKLEKKLQDGTLRERTLKNITSATDLHVCKDCDVIIEAIPEDIIKKKELYMHLDRICRRDAIFATNTSSIPISVLASFTKRPDRFIGMHFFNPVQLMSLVEIVVGKETSDFTREEITLLAQRIGKHPVTVMDSPAFVTSRLIMLMINEAIYCLYEKIAVKEDIDKAMKLGMNHPMGPLELADLVGLDVVLAILNSMHNGFKNDKYMPCPLLVDMVKRNELGRKTGRGFYTYEAVH